MSERRLSKEARKAVLRERRACAKIASQHRDAETKWEKAYSRMGECHNVRHAMGAKYAAEQIRLKILERGLK